jgi:4-hydroxy-3-methylbut-2-enyl diphosphate reductase
LGIKKITHLKKGRDKVLLIRAHGSNLTTIKKAQKLGYRIIDATCPMVKEIHRIAIEMENKGCTVIVIGDKLHDEVQGIIGQLKNKAIVIENIEQITRKRLVKINKACVVVQSTQNLEKVLLIVNKLKGLIKNLKFFNTVCRPTRIKQAEIRSLPTENDIVVVIGSKTSANTRRLYEISKSINPKTYWVEAAKDIRKDLFKGARTVGITSGSSTPDTTTQEVIKTIRKI